MLVLPIIDSHVKFWAESRTTYHSGPIRDPKNSKTRSSTYIDPRPSNHRFPSHVLGWGKHDIQIVYPQDIESDKNGGPIDAKHISKALKFLGGKFIVSQKHHAYMYRLHAHLQCRLIREIEYLNPRRLCSPRTDISDIAPTFVTHIGLPFFLAIAIAIAIVACTRSEVTSPGQNRMDAAHHIVELFRDRYRDYTEDDTNPLQTYHHQPSGKAEERTRRRESPSCKDSTHSDFAASGSIYTVIEANSKDK
ncbi:MAG: hypothetical protein Q9181_005658 [Wetmoreana brouardii]